MSEKQSSMSELCSPTLAENHKNAVWSNSNDRECRIPTFPTFGDFSDKMRHSPTFSDIVVKSPKKSDITKMQRWVIKDCMLLQEERMRFVKEPCALRFTCR